ncbi:MAG: response regulator [Lewinellaceae bacterium]|nr:response regulator [Lewinellaceae bacterium]
MLIIEDNEEVREYIRYCLDTSKYNITEVWRREEGIQKAQALIPDLIISDVMMPKKMVLKLPALSEAMSVLPTFLLSC